MNTENITSWPEVVIAVAFGLGVLVLTTIVVVVVIKAWARHTEVKAEVARDEAFRKLAESYDSLLHRTAAAQQAANEELTRIGAGVETMTQLLRAAE
ncbi:MAG: hypothetical protein M3345_06470 [Actinomycetota bacterium]|nr:hypothetical protein [Actinomycetota bacterium]